MKIAKRCILILLLVCLFFGVYNYPKLNILAGYSAKNTASSVFLGGRTLAFTNATDNNFSPVDFATDTVDFGNKVASSSVLGLLSRKAVYREGVGAVLTLNSSDENSNYLVPKRTKADNITPFPFGNAPQKDTVFNNIDYVNLRKTVNSIFGENKTRAVLVLYKDQLLSLIHI